jgi:type II secretory pathway pseudopilin PulG
MLSRASGPRAGITLVEVLAALFILGVGLLALLTLFPLGALSMARAVRDDRAAAIAANATALADAFDYRHHPHVYSATMAHPPDARFLAPRNGVPGYPVYLDAYYANLLDPRGGNPFKDTVALGALPGVTPGLPRTTPGLAGGTTSPRLAACLDEIVFDRNGEPTGSNLTPKQVSRPVTYTWAWLVRPVDRFYLPGSMELAVVVYASRRLDLPGGETVYPTSTNYSSTGPPTNLVDLDWSGAIPHGRAITPAEQQPKIRKGTWVLDTTYRTRTASNGQTYGTVNAWFYQVAGVRDTGPRTMQLELETNLRDDVRALVVMENVIAVFERGTGRKP